MKDFFFLVGHIHQTEWVLLTPQHTALFVLKRFFEPVIRKSFLLIPFGGNYEIKKEIVNKSSLYEIFSTLNLRRC